MSKMHIHSNFQSSKKVTASQKFSTSNTPFWKRFLWVSVGGFRPQCNRK